MKGTVGVSTQVSVLGRIEVTLGGSNIDLGTPRQRSIVAALALSDGRAVPFDTLVERVWGAAAPATAVGTMQRYVASLRGAIETGRRDDRSPSVLVTEGAAYALRVPGGGRDVDRFHDGVATARRLLSVVPDHLRPTAPQAQASDVLEACDLLSTTLRLWRGEPYADLGDHDTQVLAERSRLGDLHTSAIELRLIALLAMGRHTEILGDLESMTALHPLHERWWALRAVALVRSGRQGAALEVLGQLRGMLAEQLGVDPSPPLQELYGDILRQDSSLDWDAPSASAPVGLPHANHATALRSPRPAPARPRWPLVGRSDEFEAIGAILEAAPRNTTRAALVTGEAGSGKTRIVQELMLTAHDEGATIALGHCTEHAPALWPVRTALKSFVCDDTIDIELLQEHPEDFGTWQHVLEGLRRATAEAPVVMVIEDLQWADTATLELLEHLVAAPDPGPLALVLTRRTNDGENPRVSRLAAAVARAEGLRVDLGRLDPMASRKFASTVNPGVDDIEVVCERGGGNAFFIAELALSGGRVRGGLADVVRSRVARLDEDARAALDAASTVEGDLDLDLLAAMLGCTPDDAEEAIEPAVRAGLIAGAPLGTSGYTFEHEVVRDVLRSDLRVVTRTKCRRAADELRRARQASVGAQGTRGVEGTEAVAAVRADSWRDVASVMRIVAAEPSARAS